MSLMTDDTKDLFMCLFAICVSFLMKCLVAAFAHFLIELFGFLLVSIKSSFHILVIFPLSDL